MKIEAIDEIRKFFADFPEPTKRPTRITLAKARIEKMVAASRAYVVTAPSAFPSFLGVPLREVEGYGDNFGLIEFSDGTSEPI